MQNRHRGKLSTRKGGRENAYEDISRNTASGGGDALRRLQYANFPGSGRNDGGPVLGGGSYPGGSWLVWHGAASLCEEDAQGCGEGGQHRSECEREVCNLCPGG